MTAATACRRLSPMAQIVRNADVRLLSDTATSMGADGAVEMHVRAGVVGFASKVGRTTTQGAEPEDAWRDQYATASQYAALRA